MLTRLYAPLVLAVLLLFSSCTKDYPTPDYTKAWLHEADGDVLTFRNPASGATETLRATVTDETETSGRVHEQTIRLTYTGQADANAGLRLEFNSLGDVLIQPLLAWDQTVVKIMTNKGNHLEFADGSTNASALLDDDVRLDQRTYALVVNGRFNFLPALPGSPRSANTLREFWYAKHEGLVAYTKTDGQTWYRVW